MPDSPTESLGQPFSIRRSVTLPTKLNSASTRGSGTANPNLAENVIYYHPSAKIVHFAPRALAPIPSSSAPSDFDYPVDTIETLPWRSATERTVATAPLRLERVHGLTVFLKCGNVVHAILKNSQCWCVDGVSKFVLRIRPLTYYRIEIPNESEDDKVRVEDLKAALPTVLRYEVTPCPFKRAFTIELPEEATAPRRKKAWRPKGRKEGATTSIEGDRPHTGELKPEFLDSASTGEDTDGAATDDSVVTPEKSESAASDDFPTRDLSPSPVNNPEPFIHHMPIRRSVTELPQTFDTLRAKFDVPAVIEEQPNSEAESESDPRLEQTTPSKPTFTGKEEDPTDISKDEIDLTVISAKQESSPVISGQEPSEATQSERHNIQQEPAEPPTEKKSTVAVGPDDEAAMDVKGNESIDSVAAQEESKEVGPTSEQTPAEHGFETKDGSDMSSSTSEKLSPVKETHDVLAEASKEPSNPALAQENHDSTPVERNIAGPLSPSLIENEIPETVLAEVSCNKLADAQSQDHKFKHGIEAQFSDISTQSQPVDTINSFQVGDTLVEDIPAETHIAGSVVVEGEPTQITGQSDHEEPMSRASESKDIPGPTDPVKPDHDLNDLSPSTPESFHSADLDSSPGSISTRATPVPSPSKVQELKMLHDARSSPFDLAPPALSSDTVSLSELPAADVSCNNGPSSEHHGRLSTHQMAREAPPKPSLSIPSNPRRLSGRSASPSDLTHMSAEFRRRAQATRQRDVSPMPPPSTIYQPTPGEETASLISKALTLVLVPPIHLFIVLLHIAARIVINPAASSIPGLPSSKSQQSIEPADTEDDFSFPLEREPSSEYEDAEMTKKLDPWDLD
ncbi:hypothetical protein N7478_009407 [Penicillium angulare]|uniref:uncharacterized protein n=1 Tax=Penicillium angulare TaxID=116970 RepID=UPI0025411DC2|nr:uncharacterized protein N7478_009407 [Penicillium angulare]KAJ5266599.1 hypothetical protein N7478_009407 [Penicillium angulare]